MINSTKRILIVIYTNYFVAIFILKQIILIISNIDKLNFQLLRVSQYLSNFDIIIRYKFNKFNIVFNVLFRLLIITLLNVNDKINILNILYDYIVTLSNYELRTLIIQNFLVITYYVILIKMSNNYKF